MRRRRRLGARHETAAAAQAFFRKAQRAPARETVVDSAMVKELRATLGLSQAKFSALLTVELTTLQNWEQGRREPQGPARNHVPLMDSNNY